MNSEQIRTQIERNAKELFRLHSEVHSTHKHRDESIEAQEAWHKAAKEFRERYDQLAFPGGYERVLDKLISGEPTTVETAICFLEVRPFFFRSGYMFKDILRKCRKAPLSKEQAERFAEIEKAVITWRESKYSRLVQAEK